MTFFLGALDLNPLGDPREYYPHYTWPMAALSVLDDVDPA